MVVTTVVCQCLYAAAVMVDAVRRMDATVLLVSSWTETRRGAKRRRRSHSTMPPPVPIALHLLLCHLLLISLNPGHGESSQVRWVDFGAVISGGVWGWLEKSVLWQNYDLDLGWDYTSFGQLIRNIGM